MKQNKNHSVSFYETQIYFMHYAMIFLKERENKKYYLCLKKKFGRESVKPPYNLSVTCLNGFL